MSASIHESLELVRRAKRGDPEALLALFERYYEPVRRIVRLRLGAALRQKLESGDIVQEVFIEALAGFDRFEVHDESSLINWLAVIARSKISDLADYHGAQKRGPGLQVPISWIDKSGTLGLNPSRNRLLPPDKAHRADQEARLELAITRLPDDSRELIILREFTGLSWDAVAKATGIVSPDAARMAHSKALMQLTTLMHEGRQRTAQPPPE